MSSASGRKLPQSTYDAVVKLCEDKANTVFIVSGLNDKGLMQVRESCRKILGDTASSPASTTRGGCGRDNFVGKF